MNNEGGYKALARKYDVSTDQVRRWVNTHKLYGSEGLMKALTKTTYTGDYKRHVLDYREAHQLSFREVANHFGIRNYSIIVNWHRKLRDEGPTGLERKTRGRKFQMTEKDDQKGKGQGINETEREELNRVKEELRLAKLENIILKKLNALPPEQTKRK